jgi:hypothetical protein
MRTTDEIIKIVPKELIKYPNFNRVHSAHILERVVESYPERNLFVRLLLLSADSNCSVQQALINVNNILGELLSCGINSDAFFKRIEKLNAKDERFDDHIYALYYEIGGYKWLKNRGFENILYLAERDGISTPDLRATKCGQEYLIEVKSQTDHVGTRILYEDEIYRALYPDYGKDHIFSYEFFGYDIIPLRKEDYIEMRKIPELLARLAREDIKAFKMEYNLKNEENRDILRQIFIRRGHSTFMTKRRNGPCLIDVSFKTDLIKKFHALIEPKAQKACKQIKQSGIDYDCGLILLYVKLDHDLALCCDEVLESIRKSIGESLAGEKKPIYIEIIPTN